MVENFCENKLGFYLIFFVAFNGIFSKTTIHVKILKSFEFLPNIDKVTPFFIKI